MQYTNATIDNNDLKAMLKLIEVKYHSITLKHHGIYMQTVIYFRQFSK
jgi:hypothetical protein